VALSGEEQRKLHEAIVAHFSIPELERAFEFSLEVELASIAPSQSSKKRVVFEILKWAKRVGRTEELVEALKKERPNVSEFQTLTLRDNGADQKKCATVGSGPDQAREEPNDPTDPALTELRLRLSDFIRIDRCGGEPSDLGIVVVDVGLLKVLLRKISGPRSPVYCGCRTARIVARFGTLLADLH
jgi:hypothetical protein